MALSWAVTKGIELAVKWINDYIHRVEIANEATKEAVSALEDVTSEVETLNSKIKDLQTQIDGLDPITNEEDIKKLKEETAELKTQLAILKEKERIAKRDANDKAVESLEMTQRSRYKTEMQTVNMYGRDIEAPVLVDVTKDQEAIQAMLAYGDYEKKVYMARRAQAKMSADTSEWNKQQKIIDENEARMKSAREHASELMEVLMEQKEGLDLNTESGQQWGKTIDTVIMTYTDWLNAIDPAVEALEKQNEAEKETANTRTSAALSISETIDQLNTRLKPTLDALKSAYQDIFETDDNGKVLFKPENVNLSMFDNIKSKIDEINKNEELGIKIDTTALDNLAKTLTSVDVTEDKAKRAFDDFATEIYNAAAATNGITDETVRFVAQMLESIGVANAEEVAMNALSETKASEVTASYDLADASEEEIAAMLGEAQAAGITEEAIARFALNKILANNAHVETQDDINRIFALAKAAGIGAEALAKLAQFKNDLANETDPKTRQWIIKSINEYTKTLAQEIQGVKIEFTPKDTSKSSKSSSAKDTAKEFDWIEQSIENVEKEIQKLDDVVNSAYSTFSQKNEALAQEIGKVTEEIGLQQKAYEAYMQKANSIGLSEDYKSLVRDGAINIENVSNEDLQKKISEYQQWYEKAVSVSDAISDLNEKLKDLHVKGYDLKADRFEKLLESQSITEKQYLEEMKRLYREYYENQTEYAQKAHEAKLKLLDKEKSYLNSVANAAASLFDKEISKISDGAKEQAKPYKDQIKGLENQIKEHEKAIKAYEKEIDLLNDRKKPLQDELEALEDKAREENLILDLQKKQYELNRAENQRDKLVYKDDQMIYNPDLQGIRDRKKEVDDAKLEIQKNDIQKQIDALDEEIEKYNELIDAVNDQIDALDEYIDGLNEMIDQINENADAQVEALEKMKNKWQEVIDQQEEAQNILLLTGEFGADAINRILAGDETLLTQWKQNYISTLGELDMENQGYIGSMTERLAKLYGTDLTPLQEQFGGISESADGVVKSIGNVVNAISGSGNGTSNNEGGSEGANAEGGTGSLKDSILQETETAMEAFDQHTDKLTNEVVPAINDAASAVGGGGDDERSVSKDDKGADGGNNESVSLEDSILQETETAVGAFDQHANKLNNEVVPAIQLATKEMEAFNEAADTDIHKVITIEYQVIGSAGGGSVGGGGTGGGGTGGATGASSKAVGVGKAFADGYNGLKHDEKNALRSEYGQQELTVYPDGTTELTTQPTMSDLPKDTVIFNEEQTKKILSGSTLSSAVRGRAFADGTASRYMPLSPDDPALELRRKFDAYAEKIGGKIEDILMPVNAIQRHFEDFEKIVNNNMVYNTVNNSQPTISVGDININCPGVTKDEVAKQIGSEFKNIFFGMGMKAYQRSMITR